MADEDVWVDSIEAYTKEIEVKKKEPEPSKRKHVLSILAVLHF